LGEQPTGPTSSRRTDLAAMVAAAVTFGLTPADARHVAANGLQAFSELLWEIAERRGCALPAAMHAMSMAVPILFQAYAFLARRALETGDIDVMRATLEQIAGGQDE